MDRVQLIEFSARALYEGWREEENQRRREQRAVSVRNGLVVISQVGAMAKIPPYDLPPYEATPRATREMFAARARPMVLALEEANLLAVGEERVYDVEIDDPDLERPYSFTGVAAFSAQAAAYEGARRVARVDPLNFLYRKREDKMQFPGYGPPDDDSLLIESSGLIEAIAMYASVRRHPNEEWASGDALWQGYDP